MKVNENTLYLNRSASAGRKSQYMVKKKKKKIQQKTAKDF